MCVWIALTNMHLLINPWEYTFYFWDLLYGISHGFDITLDLLVMAWNFKDIVYTISTLHIIWPGLNSYSPMDNLNIMLLSLMVDSDVFNVITIGGFHLYDWS